MSDVTDFTYVYLREGVAHRETFPSLKEAMDCACHHVETEDALVFQITGGPNLTLSGFDIVDALPDWNEWKRTGGHHPADLFLERVQGMLNG